MRPLSSFARVVPPRRRWLVILKGEERRDMGFVTSWGLMPMVTMGGPEGAWDSNDLRPGVAWQDEEGEVRHATLERKQDSRVVLEGGETWLFDEAAREEMLGG